MATNTLNTLPISNSEGLGILDFDLVLGRTVVRRALAKSPLRLLTPKNHGSTAWVYTSNYGGGFVGSDQITLDIQLRPGAEAVILTQSATKIYRSSQGSSQVLCANVHQGASLILFPDPVICFAESKFEQKQTIALEENASLILVDILNSGRYASGERWAFNRFKSQICVSRKKEVIFFDSLLLDSKIGDIKARIGRFNSLGTILMIGPAFSQFGWKVLEDLSSQSPRAYPDFVLVGSPLRQGEGAVLRIAAVTPEKLSRTLYSIFDFLYQRLGDNPWERKW